MRNLLILLLLPLLAMGGGQTVVSTGNHRKIFSAACNAPTLTYQWEMWNAANTCNGGSACTNGAGLDTVNDSAGADTLTQGTSGNRPIYTTASISGLAAANWNTSNMQLNRSVAPSNNTTMTWFVVFNSSAIGTSQPITGNSSGTGAFELRVNATGNIEMLKGRVTSIGTSTGTYSASTWYAVLATYDQGTGAWAIYKCSGGTCAADGSGTNAVSFSVGADRIGFYSGDGVFSGLIAEVNYRQAITTTGYGAYALCKYGL